MLASKNCGEVDSIQAGYTGNDDNAKRQHHNDDYRDRVLTSLTISNNIGDDISPRMASNMRGEIKNHPH